MHSKTNLVFKGSFLSSIFSLIKDAQILLFSLRKLKSPTSDNRDQIVSQSRSFGVQWYRDLGKNYGIRLKCRRPTQDSVVFELYRVSLEEHKRYNQSNVCCFLWVGSDHILFLLFIIRMLTFQIQSVILV